MDSSVKTNTRGFSEELLNEISWAKDEPEWLRRRRMEGWQAWSSTPMPSRKKDEEWRRTDISALDLDAVVPLTGPQGPADRQTGLPEGILSSLEGENSRSGLLAHSNLNVALRELSQDLASKGVVLTDLDRAVKDHPDMVKQYLNSAVSPTASKFAALHAAFWSGGIFLYVPRNVEIELPVHYLTWADREGIAVMPHVLAVVDTGASVTLVNESVSVDGPGPAMANSVVELVVGSGSRLRYVSLQRWGDSVFSFGHTRALISEGRRTVIAHSGAGESLHQVLDRCLFTRAWCDRTNGWGHVRGWKAALPPPHDAGPSVARHDQRPAVQGGLNG